MVVHLMGVKNSFFKFIFADTKGERQKAAYKIQFMS